MSIRGFLSGLFVAFSLVTTQASAGDELTLIVNRGEDSATYYLSMPADEFQPILGTDPALLFSENGRVPIEQFRLTGSFDLADEIFAGITGSLGEQPFAFESMSMMVHPTATPLPFAAPWDAYTAISVCSVDYDQDDLVPGVLQMYYGGFTDQVYGDEPLNIHFPQTGRDTMQVVVHRYDNGHLSGTEVRSLPDGATLVIERTAQSAPGNWVLSIATWLGLLGVAAAAFVILRSRFGAAGSGATTAKT